MFVGGAYLQVEEALQPPGPSVLVFPSPCRLPVLSPRSPPLAMLQACTPTSWTCVGWLPPSFLHAVGVFICVISIDLRMAFDPSVSTADIIGATGGGVVSGFEFREA